MAESKVYYQLAAAMPLKLREQFRRYCEANDTTVSREIRRFINETLAAAEHQKSASQATEMR